MYIHADRARNPPRRIRAPAAFGMNWRARTLRASAPLGLAMAVTAALACRSEASTLPPTAGLCPVPPGTAESLAGRSMPPNL